MPKNGLVEIEAVAAIGVQTAGSVLDLKKADSQLWTIIVIILQYYWNFCNNVVIFAIIL